VASSASYRRPDAVSTIDQLSTPDAEAVAGGVAARGCQRPEPGPSLRRQACDRRRSSLRALRGALGGGASDVPDGRRWQPCEHMGEDGKPNVDDYVPANCARDTAPLSEKRRFTTWSARCLGHLIGEDGEVAHAEVRQSVPASTMPPHLCSAVRFSPGQTEPASDRDRRPRSDQVSRSIVVASLR